MKPRELTSRAIILAGGERRNFEVVRACCTWIKQSLTIWAVSVIATCRICKADVKAVALGQFQRILKVVDFRSGELCSDVAGGAPEDRVDKVFLLEEHTPVVRAFPSVVEREDARVLLGSKVSSQCVSAYRVIVVG